MTPKMQTLLLVGLLELGGELRAAVDLRDANGKGHAVRQGVHCLKTTPGSERTSNSVCARHGVGAGAQGAARARHARARGFAQPSPGVSSGSGCGPPMEVE